MSEERGLQLVPPVLHLALASLISVSLAALGVVWGRRSTKVPKKTDLKTEEEFEEINKSLQDNLREHIGSRIEVVRGEMKVRKLQLARRVGEVRREEEQELELLRERHRREVEEVKQKYQADIETVSSECQADLVHLLDSLRGTKMVLADNEDLLEAEVLGRGRGELECPVCLEEMRPPRRIWQCSDGHPVCATCRSKPQVNCCPTCRKYLVGRSTIAEKLARALWGEEGEVEEVSEDARITLTGYREVKVTDHQTT